MKKQKTVVRGSNLSKGMLLSASYNRFNEGTNYVEILGVICKPVDDYADPTKPDFDSVREAFKAAKVSSLPDLEKKARDDNKMYRLLIRDLCDNDTGDYYYLYDGKWCRGSGAEPLQFCPLTSKEREDLGLG